MLISAAVAYFSLKLGLFPSGSSDDFICKGKVIFPHLLMTSDIASRRCGGVAQAEAFIELGHASLFGFVSLRVRASVVALGIRVPSWVLSWIKGFQGSRANPPGRTATSCVTLASMHV